MNRREFIRTSAAGLAGLSVIGAGNIGCTLSDEVTVDKVKLGKTGLKVSRIAMGTGTVGGGRSSNQTRLGMNEFVKLAHHAYERGIRFYDMADSYGSMPFVGEAIKTLPREKLTLLSKMWTQEDNAPDREPVDKALDRFRQEAGTEYFDIILLHCMTAGGWSTTRKYYMDELSKAKQKGIVKTVGISSHNLEALVEAVDSPWVDVIMARINPFGSNMDGTPDEIKAILGQAQKNGKGIIAMKVFGQGDHVRDDEREQSIRYVVHEGNVHCMTLGMESIAQMDDAIGRTMRIVKK